MGDVLEMFIQKSTDAFVGLGKYIKNLFAPKKVKKKNDAKTVKPIKILKKKGLFLLT